MAALLVLLIAADRVAVAVTDHELATHIKSSQQLARAPSVRVRGFPFLTQLAAHDVHAVDVTLTDFVAGARGRTLQIAKLDVALHQVHLNHSFSGVRVDSGTATAQITYAALTSTLGVPVSYGGATSDGSGRLSAGASATVLGQSVSGSVSAEVRISAGNVLSFVDPKATVDGTTISAPAIVDALSGVFGLPISLLRLPFGLTVNSVRTTAAGLTVSLTGTDITYG